MNEYGVYRENETLELEEVISADSYRDAAAKAKIDGYEGKHYRIKELPDED